MTTKEQPRETIAITNLATFCIRNIGYPNILTQSVQIGLENYLLGAFFEEPASKVSQLLFLSSKVVGILWKWIALRV